MFFHWCNVCGVRQAYHPDLEAAAVKPAVQGACRSCGQYDWRTTTPARTTP